MRGKDSDLGRRSDRSRLEEQEEEPIHRIQQHKKNHGGAGWGT